MNDVVVNESRWMSRWIITWVPSIHFYNRLEYFRNRCVDFQSSNQFRFQDHGWQKCTHLSSLVLWFTSSICHFYIPTYWYVLESTSNSLGSSSSVGHMTRHRITIVSFHHSMTCTVDSETTIVPVGSRRSTSPEIPTVLFLLVVCRTYRINILWME